MIIRSNSLRIPLKDESIHCVITSPPYWGLRDYGVSGQLGLEKTPEEYVAKMVEVFREVKRILRKDGTLWLNLGDSYVGSWGDSGHRPERSGVNGHQRDKNSEWFERHGHPNFNPPSSRPLPGLKSKDLCGIPWRVAFAMQEDGPCTVFDPFIGSGTVGVVAQKYNRRWIGLELKPDYCRMAKRRTLNTDIAMI